MSKMLEKISKLLNQAENAGTPEEAATFMAKVQELATINGVDLAVARMHQANKEKAQEPEERRIQVNPFTRRSNRKWFIELAMRIADVNDVKYLIGGGDYTLHAVGFPSDLDVVEALFAHLSVQMAMECDEALARGDNKRIDVVPKMKQTGHGYYVEDTDDDGVPIIVERMVPIVDGRIFRGNFYEAFVQRIHGRLWEIRKSVERERGVEEETSSTALALRDKREEVGKAHEAQRAQVQHLTSWKGADEGRRGYDYTGTAHQRGRESAERVPIDERGREVKK